MPKTFTDSQRAYIKAKLLEEARACIEQFGLRKTTVDEIVKRAKIPKGTFYLFYRSKELLLFDVVCSLHDEYQEKLMVEIGLIKDSINPKKLTDIIFELYRSLEGSFLFKLITSGELEVLFRTLPPETAELHAEKDDFRMEELVSIVPNMDTNKIQAYSAALRGVFISMLYKREIGDQVFDQALKIMIHGIVIQMFEGEKQ